MAVVEKGKHCIAVVANVLEKMEQGQLQEASQELDTVKNDGIDLTKEAEVLVKRLEPVESHYKCREEEIMRKIGELGRKEEELNGRIRSTEATLDGRKRQLQAHNDHLSNARSRLQSARENRRRAERRADEARVKGGFFGAAVGLLVGGPVGLVVGAAGGTGVGHLIEADHERDAEREVSRCERECRSAENSVRGSENAISSIRTEIASLRSQVDSLQQSRDACHRDRDEIKGAIVFLKQAAHFWSDFTIAAQEGTDRTDLLRKLVDKARQKEDLGILKCRGSQTIANSFIEAWECIGEMVKEGSSNHVFQIEFQCKCCMKSKTALPYVEGSDFICNTCYI